LILAYNNSFLKRFINAAGFYYRHSAIHSFNTKAVYKKSATPDSSYRKLLDYLSSVISKAAAPVHNFFAPMAEGSRVYNRFIKSSLIFRYENLIYLLCLWAFIDYFTRTYIGGAVGSLWDKLYLAALCMAWLYKWVKLKDLKIQTTPLDVFLFLFYGAALIVFIVNSLSYAQSFEGMRAAVQNTFYFFIATQLIKDRQNAVNILKVFVMVMLILSLHGIYQYIIGVEMPPNWVDSLETGIRTRVFSIIGSPNILASLMTLIAPVALAFAFAEKKLVWKLFYLGAFVAMSLCLVFTFSRGAWIGYLIAMGIFVLMKDGRLIIPALLALFGASALVPSITARLTYMLSPEYIESSLRAGRLVRWIEGLDIIRTRPFMGMGHGAFGGAVAVNNEVANVFYMDNYFLKTAVEMGILGLAAFTILMAAVFIWSLRTAVRLKDKYLREVSAGAFCGLAGVIVHNFVENVFEVPMMVAYFWLIAAVVMWFFNNCELKGRELFE
jgi:O-antigen ligase